MIMPYQNLDGLHYLSQGLLYLYGSDSNVHMVKLVLFKVNFTYETMHMP